MKPTNVNKITPSEPVDKPVVSSHMFEAPPSLREDQLISGPNEKVYAFHLDQKHLTLRQRLGLMPRAQKILAIAGIVSAVFVISMIILSFAMYEPVKKSVKPTSQSTKAISGTEDLNNDGTIDTEETKIALGDVNNDGLVNDDDIAFAEADVNGDGVIDSSDATVSEEDVSWWQNLLSTVTGGDNTAENDSTTGDDTDVTSDDEVGLDDTADTPNEDSDIAPGASDEDVAGDNEDSSGSDEDVEIDDPIVTMPAPAPNNKSSTNLTVASWNILRIHNSSSGTPTGIRAILQKAQVIGLQEVGLDGQKKAIDKLASSSIGVYHPPGNTPIIWNNSHYDKTASGYKRIATRGVVKYATYVKLRNRSTGKQLYVFNFHAVVGVSGYASQGCSTKACDVYKYEMSKLSSYIKARKSDNIPIFVTGDFNANYRISNTCKITWLACAAFKNIGLKSGFELTNLTGIGSTSSTIGSSDRLIDYIFSWERSDVEPISVGIIGPNAKCHNDSSGQNHCWNGSDHKPSLFTVKLH